MRHSTGLGCCIRPIKGKAQLIVMKFGADMSVSQRLGSKFLLKCQYCVKVFVEFAIKTWMFPSRRPLVISLTQYLQNVHYNAAIS